MVIQNVNEFMKYSLLKRNILLLFFFVFIILAQVFFKIPVAMVTIILSI